MWAVQGNKATLSWRDGIPYVFGIGEQLAHLPAAASAEVMGLIERAEAMWTLAPCRSIDFDISGDTDFVKRVRAAPNDTHFAISWHPEDDEERAVVAFHMCLPDSLFAEMLPSWQSFITGGTIASYKFILDYLGFRIPEAATDNVTPEEWAAADEAVRKSAKGSGVTISFIRGD
jgi:hypothetical protein